MKFRIAVPRGPVTKLMFLWLLVAVTPDANAQSRFKVPELTVPETWDFDFDLFQTVLENEGLRSRNGEVDRHPQARWNRTFSSPSRSVMILTGNLDQVSNWRTFNTFLSEGGVILAASDEPSSVYGFFSIDYGPVIADGSRSGWLEYRDCVRVTNISSSVSMMQDVKTIVTNRSGWIDRLDDSLDYYWSPMARLSERVRPLRCRRQPLIAVARRRDDGNGRLIVIADDSPLSNGMLWHGDNLTLLLNLVQELTRDERDEFAFLHDGQPTNNHVNTLLQEASQHYLQEPNAVPEEMLQDLPIEALADLPPEALADLPAETLLRIANSLAARIEDSNVLNEVATDRPRRLADRFYHRGILFILCATALAVFVARGFLGAQVALPWLRQRRHPEHPEHPASLSEMEYHQAAQALARDVCRYLTGSRQPNDWEHQLQPRGDRWQELYTKSPAPQSTAEALALVLAWSTNSDDAALSRPEFEKLGQSIHQLKQLYQPPEVTGLGLN